MFFNRTDFYYVTNGQNSPIGLPEGVAENYVKYAFYKWDPRKKLEERIECNIPEPITEIVVESDAIEETININNVVYNSELMVKKQENFSSSECYNGAVHETYSWSQTIKEIDIIIKVPENTLSKHLVVDIFPKKMQVKLKTNNTMLLEGELYHKCKCADAIWSLDKNRLEIHLEKLNEMWWECLLIGEPKLDISKIDCSRPFEELSEEAQAKIEELTWNQEQKRLGLPTSEEKAMHETLRKAWNADGSPFTGSFDPSIIKYN